MQFKDYYETLGVSRSADAEEVKRAYRVGEPIHIWWKHADEMLF